MAQLSTLTLTLYFGQIFTFISGTMINKAYREGTRSVEMAKDDINKSETFVTGMSMKIYQIRMCAIGLSNKSAFVIMQL